MLEDLAVLRSYSPGSGLDELVALATAAKALLETYDTNTLAPPLWLTEVQARIQSELHLRGREFQEAYLLELHAERDSESWRLSREALTARIAQLEELLAKP